MILKEMDTNVTLAEQMKSDSGPIVLINKFNVIPTGAQEFVAAWTLDAQFMKQQPGFISTQLYHGIAGSGVFVNYAVWESVSQFARAFSQREFQANLARYPASTVAEPHLFSKMAVTGICVT